MNNQLGSGSETKQRAVKETEEQPDLATVSWRFEAWTREFPLNKNTVLDYFKHSPFYDRQCNNELILQQGADVSKLKSLTGIEYEIDTESGKGEFYFVIRKQHRESPTSVRVLGLFYIVGVSPQNGMGPERGTVFPLPDMHSVFCCNLVTAMYYMNSAFKELSEAVRFKPARPYTWEFKEANGSTAPGAATTTSSAAKPAHASRHQYSSLVDEVMHKMMRGDV